MSRPSEEITESPTGWVAKHVRQYLDSDGAQGGKFYGVDALLITTRGRRSGLLRRTALYYGRDGERYVVIASNGGSPTHPNWYRNLAADPTVSVQVGAERFTARAHTVTGPERAALWDRMAAIYPSYNDYQAKATREIPVVVLERT
ncbi:MAG TPA: nitroreductase family deazaflavin-dependent oxidoreductase [Actinophytocola sp.]|uniref:nitroreductase family deazaflavin-dependent oxidoreductase n=1 Tax=Actinophytocola sp. TaxID=1872138 RepID=UPI002DBF9676|nr:nitroreductase family deazaflavin-dependent oxidoreductase [Actinophytocola sp.]HEU5470377.1 nitroreductase family deazaflavin-dependent oxidoreductase [Actinophytocola sp.]